MEKTKYFLNIEKRYCKQGTITQLKIYDNDLVYTDKEILNECVSFYQSLYSFKANTDNPDSPVDCFFFQNNKRKSARIKMKSCSVRDLPIERNA